MKILGFKIVAHLNHVSGNLFYTVEFKVRQNFLRWSWIGWKSDGLWPDFNSTFRARQFAREYIRNAKLDNAIVQEDFDNDNG